MQPNGLLARFFTIVDNFTHMNMTKEEALEVAREDMGRQDAEAKVERGLRDEDPWTHGGPPGDGTSRWRADIATIRVIQGEAEVEKALEIDRTRKGAV